MGMTVDGLMSFVCRAAALAAFFARLSFGIASKVSSGEELQYPTKAISSEELQL